MILFPGNYPTAKPSPLVIYHGGNNETYASPRVDALKAALIQSLLDNGYIVAASNAHGNNWGNQNALNDYGELYGYVRTCLQVSRTVLLSQSMGGCSGLMVAARKTFGIKGWAGIFPVCNLRRMYDNNYGGLFTGQIKTAYGVAADGADYATKTAGWDPVLRPATDYAGLRMRFYASPSDTVVEKAYHTDPLVTLVTGQATECAVQACVGDHGDPSHFQAADLVTFLGRCV
jgi:hypothetical protein